MNIFRRRLILLAAAMLTVAAACKDSTTETITDINAIVFPETNIDYYKKIQPVFNIGCTNSGCHSMADKAGNLDLSDYFGLRQRFFDVVIVRDTVNSRLIWYIDGRQPSPTWHRPLNPNQVKGFKTWIMEGATDTIKEASAASAPH